MIAWQIASAPSWRMPTPPLPEQPGRTPVPVRDAAWQEWARREIPDANPPERAFAKACFDAGWEARGIVVDHSLKTRSEVLDEARKDMLTLFPTEAELDPK